jgi:hypothetical protein
MKKRLAKNFVVEIKKRRGRKAQTADGNPIARAFERLRGQTPLPAAR